MNNSFNEASESAINELRELKKRIAVLEENYIIAGLNLDTAKLKAKRVLQQITLFKERFWQENENLNEFFLDVLSTKERDGH